MYCLNDQQIDYILDDIRARGVEMESLQLNLLDHICCIIEHGLEEKGDFEGFYQTTIRTFYKDALWEIEEETISLLTFKNYYVMKKTMIISGTFSAIAMTFGIIFKFMHWPGASMLIILGIGSSSFIFLPLLFTLRAKEKQTIKDKMMLGIAVGLGILISLSILFKVMHWPGANAMGLTFLILMVLLYIPLYFITGIRNPEAKVNTIVTSILMIMGCGLFFTLVNTRPYIQDNANIVSNNYLQESYSVFSAQSLVRDSTRDKSGSADKETSKLLDQTCDDICNTIELLKIKLVNHSENRNIKKIDYAQLGTLTNYDGPTRVLFGIDAVPTQPLLLLPLKEKLNALRKLISSGAASNNLSLIDLSDRRDLHTGNRVSWEVAYFYNTPLNFVLRNLTQIQLNVRFIELTGIK